MKKNLLLTSFVCLPFSIFAQSDSTNLYEANSKLSTSYEVVTPPIKNLITHTGEYSFANVISSFVSGLAATNETAQQDDDINFLIRGAFSPYIDENYPLIVLDGTPYIGRLSDINFSDIEKVTVLKDAIAIGRFGTLGKNGVISIQTKRMKQSFNGSKHSLSIQLKTGINTRGLEGYQTIQNTADYYTTAWNAIRNYYADDLGFDEAGIYASLIAVDGLGYNAYDVPNEQLLSPFDGSVHPAANLRYPQDDLRKEISRLGVRQSYDAHYQFSNGKFWLKTSGSFLDDRSYLINNGFRRYTANVSTEWKPKEWVDLKLNVMNTSTTSDLMMYTDTRQYNPIYASEFLAPIYPVYYRDAQGALESDPLLGNHPKVDWGDRAQFPNSSLSDRTDFLYNTLGIMLADQHQLKRNYLFLQPQINFHLPLGFSINNSFGYQKLNTNSDRVFNPNYGQYIHTEGRLETSELEHTRSYYKGELVWHKVVKDDHNISLTGGVDILDNKSTIASAAYIFQNTLETESKFTDRYKSNSFYSSLAYDYADKYFLESVYTLRNSSFLQDPESSIAIGLAWDMAKESFFSNAVINSFKLKSTYGRFELMKGTMEYEQTHFDAGFEMDLFNHQLHLGANYFNRNNKNDILLVYSGSAGQFLHYQGLDARSSGFEFEVNYLKRWGNVRWNTNLCHTYNKTLVKKLPDALNATSTIDFPISEGQPLFSNFYYEYAGVNAANGNALYYAPSNPSGVTEYQSDLDPFQDRRHFGTALPVHWGSLTNAFSYKNWSIYVTLNYGFGSKQFDEDYYQLMNNNLIGGAFHQDALNAWIYTNQGASIPAIKAGQSVVRSDRFLIDASYLNVKTVGLQYQFSKASLNRLKLSNLKISLFCSNVFMFSNRQGFNPTATFTGMPQLGGFYPMRNVNLGFDFGLF